jgi:hypothetical protein
MSRGSAGGYVRRCSSGRREHLGGPLLEVMVEITGSRGLHIFHVMQARKKHLDRMGEN